MNKDEITEYLTFISHYATKYLENDLIDTSVTISINNELRKFVERLRKSKTDRKLIEDLKSCKILKKTETKGLLYFIIVYLLLGWLSGRFSNSVEGRQQISDEVKEQIRDFRLKLVDIAMNLDKYKLRK